ncbi:MAG: high-potential iron-sulfur protein [Rhodocyclaceae bacterium]
MNKRRRFIALLPAAIGLGLLGTRPAQAQARVSEREPTAIALGYKDDAAQVDRKKYAGYRAGDICANCRLYTAPASESAGPCTAFGNKLVAAGGWCAAYVKR